MVALVRTLILFVYFLWEIVLANLKVAVCVLSPIRNLKPGFVAIPLEAQTDTEITILANMITLTPGTLSVEISDDRKILFIHTLFAEEPEELVEGIKRSFERRLLKITRGLLFGKREAGSGKRRSGE
ncbi:MAG: Na+/H+ antiporter subunit E [Candidatus Omnitrophica bacterium]|nr:Na+/H+ antiporter subunit E [Candidatus Omnitrophota bacterium]